jgi:hypothetical protein
MISVQKVRLKVQSMVHRLAGLALSILICSAGFAAADQPIGPVMKNAEMNARTITTALFQAKPGAKPDFSGKNLVYLDLSELNFKGANLANSDFYGTDFTGANLKGADLSHTRLSFGSDARRSFRGQSDRRDDPSPDDLCGSL